MSEPNDMTSSTESKDRDFSATIENTDTASEIFPIRYMGMNADEDDYDFRARVVDADVPDEPSPKDSSAPESVGSSETEKPIEPASVKTAPAVKVKSAVSASSLQTS